ncbi:unnamed protein product [Aspergillus oryzae]|uniref:Unnamed protein product n=1 Tax=Aspergillus oryzae TaxID=5062 RepID=A0AAN4YJG1_ASPOZ|nr:unnamed protein product [Aspergillus oryzae]GMF89590.1 unnamed protein product [Aspergillus oryzae]GMG10102.1 unnamed protein product [Aspergillus oryzae]GMG30109.1 unnamed protein product [Aspergillus oryzae]
MSRIDELKSETSWKDLQKPGLQYPAQLNTRIIIGKTDYAIPIYDRPLTGQDKKDNPVHNEHRPEHRDIKDTEPAADKPNGNGAGGALPELELRETANERTKLVVLLIVSLLVKEVKVDIVRTDVPALSEDDPQEEDNEKDDGADPAVGSERRRGIEKGLIFLGTVSDVPWAFTMSCAGLRHLSPGIVRTLASFDVCAVTAVNGVCSGSGTSMACVNKEKVGEEKGKRTT